MCTVYNCPIFVSQVFLLLTICVTEVQRKLYDSRKFNCDGVGNVYSTYEVLYY